MGKVRILVVGHSHIAALRRGWSSLAAAHPGLEFVFMSLRDERYLQVGAGHKEPVRASVPDEVRMDVLLQDFSGAAAEAELIVFCLNGNEHNNVGMFRTRQDDLQQVEARVRVGVRERYASWLKQLMPFVKVPAFVIPPPPPVEDERVILDSPSVRSMSSQPEVRPPGDRLRFWRAQREAISETAREFDVEEIPLPTDVLSPRGFLLPECCQDFAHGNARYGERVLCALLSRIPAPASGNSSLSNHPYAFLPDYMYWKRSVAQVAPGQVDPVVEPAFKIGVSDKVATAGSCFAQHISKRLRAGGFQFLVTESAKAPAAGETAFHDFSARYGNVYTARQLVQLFDRAFGFFTPLERTWRMPNGRYCDPFRPTIEPEGYASEEAVIEACRQHLEAVRKMFLELDVFVFTLGLTECWSCRLDGAAYPIAPGVAGGTYDPRVHTFVNFGVADVVADLQSFIGKLRTVNPRARVLLTVSPVPLAATFVAGRHVLVSTVRSKAVLRVAADEVCSSHEGVYYFPSYEIIMNGDGDRNYFAADRRTVREEGVDHVMRVFMSRMVASSAPRSSASPAPGGEPALDAEIEAMNEALCDEAMLDSDEPT